MKNLVGVLGSVFTKSVTLYQMLSDSSASVCESICLSFYSNLSTKHLLEEITRPDEQFWIASCQVITTFFNLVQCSIQIMGLGSLDTSIVENKKEILKICHLIIPDYQDLLL